MRKTQTACRKCNVLVLLHVFPLNIPTIHMCMLLIIITPPTNNKYVCMWKYRCKYGRALFYSDDLTAGWENYGNKNDKKL